MSALNVNGGNYFGLVCYLTLLDCDCLHAKEIDTIYLYMNGIVWLIYVSIDAFVFLLYLRKDWTELLNFTEDYSTTCLAFFEIFLFCSDSGKGS